jgi:chromosome segregation ATPase
VLIDPANRTELFRKAFDHISERIDKVYKDLTKGKAAPMGGVAYLNLEDSEVINLRFLSVVIMC